MADSDTTQQATSEMCANIRLTGDELDFKKNFFSALAIGIAASISVADAILAETAPSSDDYPLAGQDNAE